MYTKHGHYIPGSPVDDQEKEKSKRKARCGGVKACDKCRMEVFIYTVNFTNEQLEKAKDCFEHIGQWFQNITYQLNQFFLITQPDGVEPPKE